MAKMAFKDKETEETPAPLLVFSEDEVKKVADFINYMYLNAEFSANMKSFKLVNQMFVDMHNHVSKIEQYIFEHKRTTQKKAE